MYIVIFYQILMLFKFLKISYVLLYINYLQEVLILKVSFRKNKVVSGKTSFFAISPFYTHHSTFLNSGFWQGSFVKTYCTIVVLSTNKRYHSFSKLVSIFQKTHFECKLMKAAQISSDCHINIHQSLKQKTILF